MPLNLELLQQFPPFGEMEASQLEALTSSFVFHHFEPGRTLFQRNEPGSSLFLLIRGEVSFFSRNEDKTSLLHTSCAPDVFGEVAVFGKGFRTAKAQAKTEIEVLELPKKEIQTVLSRYPELAHWLMQRMAWRLENSGTQLHLSQQTLRRRIDSDRSLHEKYIACCVEQMGTLRFIVIALVFTLLWTLAAYYRFHAYSIADPPYTLLSLLVSIVSLFFSLLVLSCQNRNEKDNKIRDEHFSETLLGTRESTQRLLQRMDEMERHLGRISEPQPLHLTAVAHDRHS